MTRSALVASAVAASAFFIACGVHASPVVIRTVGANAAAIQGGVDSFRSSLGALNLNVAGSFGTGRREINWDGVPNGLSAPNLLPANFFNVTSPRGVVLTTPGSGLEVSASTASSTPIEFGDIDASYPSLFAAFSPQRLFTAIGSNVVDVDFFVPGSTAPAFTSGFGAVFSDVDLVDTTSLSFFDPAGNSLGTFFASAFAGDGTLSFLGVRFDGGERIGRVRIVNGNQSLGGRETGDLVVMDDFIYAEPIAVGPSVVPEPATWALALLPLVMLAARSQRRTAGLHTDSR